MIQTDAIKSLLQEVGWMIHDLVDGDQIDNDEEARLVALYESALKELKELRISQN